MEKRTTIIHNPRCQKSRLALQFLSNHDIPYQVRLYLSDPLTKAELIHICRSGSYQVMDILRAKESVYSQYKDKLSENDPQWLDIMVSNPKLIERPIFFTDDFALICRDQASLEKWLAYIKK